MSDPINPLYYQRNGIQTIDYMQSKMTASQFSGYCLGNVLKYVSRAGHKSSDSYKQDLRKALWYLQKLIEVEEQANDRAMQRRPVADSQTECG